VELITLALIYKFMDDLDEESVAMGGKRSFFAKGLTSYRWRNLLPQSLSLVIVHVIFSTKERRPFLDTDTRPKLHAYFATVAHNAGCEAYRGGGCFSVGPSDLDALRAYIDGQKEHHKTRTFQDEFRMFMKKYGVEYDEAYVWD
jgi:putative transposase